MKPQRISREQMTFWQLVFSQSKANGAPYNGETLPIHPWKWPAGTYLERKLSLRPILPERSLASN